MKDQKQQSINDEASKKESKNQSAKDVGGEVEMAPPMAIDPLSFIGDDIKDAGRRLQILREEGLDLFLPATSRAHRERQEESLRRVFRKIDERYSPGMLG